MLDVVVLIILVVVFSWRVGVVNSVARLAVLVSTDGVWLSDE